MTNSRFRWVLFTVVLAVSVLPLRGLGQDQPKDKEVRKVKRDFAELLEMELSDIKQENSKLKAEVENLKKDKAKKVPASRRDLKRLKKENALLKDEIIKLDGVVKESGSSRDAALAELKKLHYELDELRKAEKQNKKIESNGADSPEVVADSELLARCKNLEDENAILKREMDERKAVDEQRKSAFDNLFKQLADIKGKLRSRDVDLEKLQAELSSESAKVQERDASVLAEQKRSEKLQQIIDGHKAEVRKLKDTIAEVRGKVASTEKQLKSEIEARQTSEAELNRIKLTDAQRKKTMDDVLTKLATAEDANLRNTSKISNLEANLAELNNQSQRERKRLQSSLKTAEDEITRLENELAQANSARQQAETNLKDTSAAIKRDTAHIVDLEAELSRMKATDAQRKKSMDKLLLEISELEAKQGDRSGELATARKDAERARKKLANLRGELDAAHQKAESSQASLANMRAELERTRKELTQLQKSKHVGSGKNAAKLNAELERLRGELDAARSKVAELEKAAKSAAPAKAAPGLANELTKLQQENGELRAKIVALTKRAKAAEAALAEDSKRGDDAKELIEMERKSWSKTKTDLEQEIAHLNKMSAEQTGLLNKLKANLAVAEKAKKDLSKETERLRNRKVDIRGSDIYKEMEQVNVALREKIVQIESERQRLAKMVKKLEKRVDRFDEDMDHEKGLRHKAEQALADAKEREDEYKELIERLMAQVPTLEKQVAELTDKVEKSSQLLTSKDENIKALKIELEKRSHRLYKAERVAEILEKHRQDVIHAIDREKLDMHYNMAAGYAREGKFEAAEREYLRALRLNPMDADVHYNLGILYDDELKLPEKAMVHYRRYLKLNPHGPDSDQVRNWLMHLEMHRKK